MGEAEDNEGNRVQLYSTEIRDNRASVRVSSEDPIGPLIYEELEEKLDELAEKYGEQNE